MVLMKNVILSVLLILAVAVAVAGVIGCFCLLQEKRKFNTNRWKAHNHQPNIKRWKKKKIANIVLIMLGIILFLYCEVSIIWNNLFFDVVSQNKEDMNVANSQYINTIKREFGELCSNETSTKWENILAENLCYSIYGADINLVEYENHIRNMMLQNGDEALERIHYMFENYAAYLEIHPEHTLIQINQIIKEQANGEDVSVEVHKEEVILYAGDIKDKAGHLSRGKVYQAGRAAQEVVNCLCRDSEADIKEIILYAALAKEYYTYAMTLPTENMTSASQYNEYILYRAGMLYDTLAEYRILKEYREHFLLGAASFFALSSTIGMGKEGMNRNHIYNVDYFRGRDLYYLYGMGHQSEGETAKECIKNFLMIKDKIPPKFRLHNVEVYCDFILEGLNESLTNTQ